MEGWGALVLERNGGQQLPLPLISFLCGWVTWVAEGNVRLDPVQQDEPRETWNKEVRRHQRGQPLALPSQHRVLITVVETEKQTAPSSGKITQGAASRGAGVPC